MKVENIFKLTFQEEVIFLQAQSCETCLIAYVNNKGAAHTAHL